MVHFVARIAVKSEEGNTVKQRGEEQGDTK